MGCGVSGPTTFLINSGTYYESINMVGAIPGASATNTVTFTSTTGNASSVQIVDAGTTCFLSNISYVYFRNLTIGSQVSSVGEKAVVLEGSCSNIEFYQCNLYAHNSAATSDYACVYYNNTNGSSDYLQNVNFIKNYMDGGYYNMYFNYPAGTTNGMRTSAMSVTIDSNIMSNAYYCAFYSNYYARYPSISYNTITSRNSGTITSWYGLYFNQGHNVEALVGNKIRSTNTSISSPTGIYVNYYYNWTGNYGNGSGLIANNDIVLYTKSNSSGMYFYYPYSNVNILHNSIYMYGTGNAYGCYLYNPTTSYKPIIKNNNFVTDAGSSAYPIYYNGGYCNTDYFDVDYNNYYSAGNYVGYASSAQTTIEDLRIATGQDINSMNKSQFYYDHPNSSKVYGYDLACPLLSLVGTDIENVTRTNPTLMGAYLFTPYVDYDIQPYALLSPSTIVMNGVTETVRIALMNVGTTAITSAKIDWSFNGVARSQVNWSGNLPSGSSVMVTLDTILPTGGINSLEIITSAPNNQTDTMRFNDTLRVKLYACDSMLSGVYTVGTSGKFTTLEDALITLKNCGVKDAVTLLLDNGTYPPVTFSGIIPGTSTTNTVTITSASGNANNVTIASTSTSTATALTVENTNHLLFKDITIGTNSSYTGIAVEMKGMCENILFYGCNILTRPNYSTSYVGVRYSGISGSTNYLKDVRFIKNTIDGGAYNMYFHYPAGSTANMSDAGMSVTIDSNTLSNAYSYGIYSNWYARYPSISYNTITSPAIGSPTDWYGMYFNYYHNIEAIVGNKIQSNNTNITNPRGIYINRYFNQSSSGGKGTGLIANNEIILHGTNTSTTYGNFCGIYIYDPRATVNLYHNSIYLYRSASTTTYGAGIFTYNTNSSYQINLLNNNLVTSLSSGTSYTLYPYYVGSSIYGSSTYGIRDYNNYFNTNSLIIVYTGATRTLAQLRSAHSQDTNSTNINPGYTTTSLAPATWTSCPVLAEVPTDRAGNLRIASTHMGCYTGVFSRDACLIEFVGMGPKVSVGFYNINVRIKNMGKDTLKSISYQFSVNGSPYTSGTLPGLSLAQYQDMVIPIGGFVVADGTTYQLKAWTFNPNGLSDLNTDNDTIATTTVGCTEVLNGTYNIASASDLTTKMTALNNCGVSGPVVFRLANGTYTNLSSIAAVYENTSSTNTITFTSQSGNASDVTIGAATSHALTLDGAKYLRFKNVTIGNTSNTTAGVRFLNTNEDIEFYGCVINSSLTGTNNTYAGVHYNNNSANYLKDVRFIKNTLNGGYANFWFNYPCNSGNNMSNMSVIIDSNSMQNAYSRGIYSNYYGYYPSISYNTITSRDSGTTTNNWYGLYFYNYNSVEKIEGNTIRSTNTSIYYPYGMYIYYYLNYSNYGTTNKSPLIANNEIILYTTGSYYGIYLYNPYSNVQLLHNSVYMYGSNTPCALYTYNGTTSYKPEIKNNIFMTNAGSDAYPIYYNGNYSSSYYTVDYNNYYSSGNYVGYAGSTLTSLSELQMTTGQDANSINENPNFIAPTTDLHTSGTTMLLAPIGAVAYDKNGLSRGQMTNMGCYHDFTPFAVDVKMLSIESPTILTPGLSTPVSVKIQNFGTTALDSVAIHWVVNGVAQSPYYWKNGPLAPFAVSSTIFLGNFTPTRGFNTVQVYVTQPNGGIDSNATNDTLSTTIFACDSVLNGTYTVGVGGNFINADEVSAVLANCGINGPVEFQFLDGTYGTISLTNIIGSSATNTVTITSYSGDAGKVTIGDVSTTGSTALTLNNVSNLIIKNITIGTTRNVTNNGVELKGYCANILFHSCVIQAYDLATSNNYAAVRYNGSSQLINYLSNVRFIKNTMIGGYYNMYLSYTAGSSNNMSSKQASVVIDSNELKDAYYYGIYNNWYGYYPSISYNSITSRATSGNYRGIHSTYYTTIDSLQGNKISITGTGTLYGMYMINYQNYSTAYGATGPMYVANNEIRVKSTGSSVMHGFYNTGGTSYYSSFDILHNSFYLEGTSGTVYGIRITPYNTAAPINVLNNLVYVSTSGIGYMIYYDDISYAGTSYGSANYNNYYKPSGTTYYGSNSYTSLSAWQAASYGQDANSVNVNPPFVDVNKDLQLSIYNGLSCPRITGLEKDIRNRDRATPTYMGCYEPFDLDASLANAMPISGISNQSIPLKVVVMNCGKDTLKTAGINWSFRGVTQTAVSWSGNLAMGEIDTFTVSNITLTPAYTNEVKIWVSAPNASTDENPTNDTILFNIYGCDSMSGVYTVGNASADFATVEDAKFALMECAIKGAVELQFVNGTYGSLFFDENIPGSSATNTLTITSAAQHADSVVFTGTTSAPALRLESINNIYFKAVTFDATSGINGVEFKKSNSNVLFYGCNILANPTTTSAAYSGVCYVQADTATTYLSDVRFIKNKISGGYYNINLIFPGGNNTTTMLNSSITIDSNELSDAYYCGILCYYYAYHPSVSYNSITSRATSATYFAMDYWYYTTIDTMVSNKIRITSTGSACGIGYAENQNTIGSKGAMFVANNEIIINGTGSGYKTGISASSDSDSSRWNFYNNSIYIASNAGPAYGIHFSPSPLLGYASNFMNNHVHLHTTGIAMPLEFYSMTYATTSYCNLDYNNYYVSGSPSSVRYGSNSYTSLAAWSAAYSQDTNSVSIAPVYTDSLNSLRFDYDSLLRAPMLPGVDNDINGNLRTTPTCIGAYEIHSMDLAFNPLLSPLNNANFCQNNTSPIEVSITNIGGIDLNMATSPLSVHVRITGATNYQKDTIISTGMLTTSQTINIVMNNALTLSDTGVYNVTAYFSQIDSNSTNDTIYSQFYVYANYSHTDTLTICANELPYTYGDSTLTAAGSYSVHFQTINGCDSIIALQVYVEPSYTHTDTATICSSQLPYTYGDSTFTIEGDYNVHFQTVKGCDSIINLALYVNPSYKDYDTVTICSDELPYTYGDSTLASAGDYDIHFTTIDDCDSIISLTLYVNPSYKDTNTVSICDTELPFTYGDSTFTAAGIYDIYFSTIEECDSIISLKLVVYPTYTGTDTIGICVNQFPFTYGDSTFTTAGDYTVVFTTINGCDSTIALTLIEDDAYKVKTTITICDNQLPYTYKDTILTAAGLYQLEYPGVSSECDTILNLTLIVNPTYDETETITICSSDLPYTYGDSVFTEGGDYIIPLLTIFGCDSVINLHLRVLEIPTTPSVIHGNTTITTAGKYTYYVDPVADADSYVWTVSNNNWTGSSTTESIKLSISDAGTGTLTVKAVNICGESNTATLDIYSSVGIEESNNTACYLGQNIPNPANMNTTIPFSIPEAGNVSFEVVSITGQVLYKKDIQANTGSNSIELNTEILPAGIYYYRIEFNGQRLVKKMTIQR